MLLLCFATTANAEEIMLAPKEIIDDYFEMADNYAFAGDYQKALEYINMVIHFEPMNPTAKYKQALLLTTMNKTDEAREIFAQAVKLDHKFANSELAVTLAQDKLTEVSQKPALTQMNNVDVPIQVTESNNVFIPDTPQQQTPLLPIRPSQADSQPTAIQNNSTQETKVLEVSTPKHSLIPYSSEYYNQLGLQYLNDGDNKTAYEYLLKAVKLDKHNFDAINNLGLFYWQQGEIKLAEQQFHRAVRLNSNSCKPLLNLGLLYKELGKDKKYYNYINKALSISPNDYLANWVNGNYYAETARPLHAIKLYKKAIDFNPEFYDGYISLGNMLAAIQRFDEAYEIYKKALTLNSADPNLYYILSKTASILDKQLEAKEYILNALNLAENDKYYLELAKVLSNMGDYEESLAILLQHFANSSDPEIINYVGLAYYKIKQPEIAVDYFKKLIALDQSKTIYFYNLALCYKSLGDRDKFFQYVDKATKILPKTPQDYVDLSYIYFDNGNKSYALNVLNDGILAFPDNKKLYMAKLSLFQTCGDTKNYVEFKTIVDKKFNSSN